MEVKGQSGGWMLPHLSSWWLCGSGPAPCPAPCHVQLAACAPPHHFLPINPSVRHARPTEAQWVGNSSWNQSTHLECFIPGISPFLSLSLSLVIFCILTRENAPDSYANTILLSVIKTHHIDFPAASTTIKLIIFVYGNQ